MDGRHILAGRLPHLDAQQRREAEERLARADALIRPHLVATAECICGEENALKYGYTRDRDWWYYHRPGVVDETWRDF